MAEFQDIMRQLGRICSTNFGECDICDLHPFCPSKIFLDKYVKSGRTERLEKMVLSWAAEHPEPEYSTWMEWLTDVGAIPKVISWDEPLVEAVYDALQNHIPADMAQKLGLKPKEG